MAVSVHIVVLIEPSRLPSSSDWRTAIGELGVPLELDGSVDAASHSGSWPAVYEGVASGFEYYLEDPGSSFLPALDVGSRTLAVDFVVHGNWHSLVCAYFAAAALARISDGLFLDEDTGDLVSADRLLADAQSAAARPF